MSNIIAFDFEFIENGRTIDPISVGLSHIDGRRYYAIFKEFKESKASPWVKENVISKLPPRFVNPVYESPRLLEESLAWKSREAIRLDILRFVGSQSPEFWGNYCAHDFVLLGQVMGTREQEGWATCFLNWMSGTKTIPLHNPMVECWPDGWPYFAHDIQSLRSHLGNPEIDLPEPTEHIAIQDADWVLKARDFLLKLESERLANA